MYWCHFEDSYQCRYSIDRVVMDFKLLSVSGDWSYRFLNFLSKSNDIALDTWETKKLGTFSRQFRVKCSTDTSFWVGVGLNLGDHIKNQVRIEFNPNKVWDNWEFQVVFNTLHKLSDPRRTEIKRWDLAIDIPVRRDNCFLVKDRRLYEEIAHSALNRTQYLGERNSVGRCKLYNKQLELGLSYPLSRLELTLDGMDRTFDSISELFPQVFVIDDLQLCFESCKVSATDKIMLQHIYQTPTDILLYDTRGRKRIHSILNNYCRVLRLDSGCVYQILNLFHRFFEVHDLSVVVSPFDGKPHFVFGGNVNDL